MAASVVYDSGSAAGQTSTWGDNVAVTFAGVAVASAAGQERLVIAGGITDVEGTGNFDAVTIDGETATLVGTELRETVGGIDVVIQAWRAPGTANTSISIVLTTNVFGGAMFTAVMACLKLSDADTLLDQQSTVGVDPTLSVDTATGGVVVAGSYGYSTGTLTATWSGLTERWDAVSGGGDDPFTGASVDVVTGETPRAISVNHAATDLESVVSAAWSFNPTAEAGDSVPIAAMQQTVFRRRTRMVGI